MTRPCRGCGEPIQVASGERNPRLWCSESCRVWAFRHPGEIRSQAVVCCMCGGALAGRRRRFCSTSCGERHRAETKRRQRKNRIPESADCVSCGETFQPKSTNHRYCSRQCSDRAKQERKTLSLAERYGGARLNDQALGAYYRALAVDPCVYCGEPADATDHIVPVSQGGENAWTNYAPACRSCNSSKADSSLLGFLLCRRADRALAPLLEQRQRSRSVGVVPGQGRQRSEAKGMSRARNRRGETRNTHRSDTGSHDPFDRSRQNRGGVGGPGVVGDPEP